jgi:hypothetical protein
MPIKEVKVTDPYQKSLLDLPQERLQQMRDEHFAEIKRLEQEMHSIDEIKDSNKIRDLLEPVVGHWIKIPGHSWYEEDEPNRSPKSVEYRIAHVVGAERWLGGDEFELVLDRLISVWKNPDYSALNVDFGTGEELTRHKVKHLSNVTVIPEDKIELTINKIELEVINKFTWVIRKAQKTAKAAEKKVKKKKEK